MRWGEGHAGVQVLARSGKQRRWLCEGGKGKGIEKSRRRGQCGGGFLRLSLCAFGVLPVPLGFGASGRFLVYMKMYFRMKSSARTYIMGLIFFALPVTALTAT